MKNAIHIIAHEFSRLGDPYKFEAKIYKTPKHSGATCFEIAMRIYDLQPHLHKWIDAEGNEREYDKLSYHERTVDSFYNLAEAKKWIKDNLETFIKNYHLDARWEDQY